MLVKTENSLILLKIISKIFEEADIMPKYSENDVQLFKKLCFPNPIFHTSFCIIMIFLTFLFSHPHNRFQDANQTEKQLKLISVIINILTNTERQFVSRSTWWVFSHQFPFC